MDLKEEQVRGVTVLQVKGRLDSTTSPMLGERLTAVLGAASARVLVDFSQLEYISSAGFRVLLQAAKRADQNTAKLVLCGVSGKVRQLFDLGGFLDLFSITATREEGITAAG
jgi:anti-sigma B factor antagonist